MGVMNATANYQLAIRQSFVNKLAIFLQQDGSRDMTTAVNRNSGVADFLFGDTTYGVVSRQLGEELFYPGVNILFLGEIDVASGRSSSTKKRYVLPTKIIVAKMIEGNTRPQVVAAEVMGVCKLLLQCLSDSHVDIYSGIPADPVFTEVSAWYHHTPYSFGDESLAVTGGDIRMAATLSLNYLDPSL